MSLEFQPFRNQYLITNNENQNSDLAFESYRQEGFHYFRSTALENQYYKSGSVSVSLLGYALDPFSVGLSNQDIVQQLAESCPTAISLFKATHHLSGRFVILYKNDNEHIVVGDSCNLRQVYYHFGEQGTVLTSSQKLFLTYYGLSPKTSSLKQQFMERADLKQKEWAWFGNKSVDDRLLKLLPNHYLDLHNKKVQRIPYHKFEYVNTSEENVLPTCIKILEGTYEALSHRSFDLMQPLTAGLDSRLLLAASRKHQKQITYYIFDRSADFETNADVEIPKKITDLHNIDFKIFTPSDITADFSRKLKRNHLQPRDLPKIRNIQYLFQYPQNGGNLLNINGNFAGITKCFYGNNRLKVSADVLRYFTGYPDDPFIRHEIESWYFDAAEYAKKVNIPLLDLFYWEQRVGNWGARISEESDIAFEELSPLCNRKLIFTIFSADYKKRKKPDFSIYKALIKEMWPELLTEPINPGEPVLAALIKRNSHSRYLASVVSHQLKKLKS